MDVKKKKLSLEWIKKHEERVRQLQIPNPWDDSLAKKSGLANIYIISTITERMNLKAEMYPDKLNCPNPQYGQFISIVTRFIKKPDQEVFLTLLDFVKDYTKRNIEIVYYEAAVETMDIRVLDTIDECLSYLYSKLIVSIAE